MPAHPRHPLVGHDPTVRGGRPYLTGTRISVADVLEWLGSGLSEAQLLQDFPVLTSEMLQAALRYSGDRGHFAY
ncbi:MAG: DUF433 domain-containing protein [Janthinobacterium lividum]